MMSRLGARASLLAAALCLALAAAAGAQTNTGRISGTVADASGGVLPGVTVTVVNERTALTRTATTDERGAYVFVDLPVGTYTVKTELSGFKSTVKNGYTLNADDRVTVDFKLDVGSVSETVQVTAAGETVNTTSGEVARVVDAEQVQNLALNGRNYMQLATLIPGSPVLDTNALDIMVGLGINTSVNGSRTNASMLAVDGGFNMDSGSNNSQISNVGIDFIEQVKIATSNFSAEYGRNSGASINVVTKSGTNQLRGSGFEYGRNDALDANNFFAKQTGVAKAALRYNDYGYTLGGPAIRSKLFFFGGEEWKKIRRQTAPTFRTLPTTAMEAGDFSAISTLVRDPLTGQPFPGNVIPSNRITADGRAIANVYAAMAKQAASYRDQPISNNALFQNPNPFDWREDSIRLDWQQSNRQRYTLRMLFDNYDTTDPGGTFINSQLPTVPTRRKRPGRNWQIGHSWTVTSNVVNEAKINAAWNGQRVPPVGDTWKRDTYGFTFPQLYTGGGRFENSIPNTSVNGFASFSGASGSLLSPTTDIAFSDNLSWLKGSHTMKFGALVVRNRKDQNGRSQYAGNVSFATAGNTITSGNAFADALLGNFRTYTESQSDPIGFFRFWQDEAFASDSWRVSRTLSVEYGVRVQYHVPTYTQSNNMASFDPSLYNPAQAVTVLPNGTLVAGSGNRFDGMVRPCGGVPDDELNRVPNGHDPSVLAVPATAPCGFYKSRFNAGPRLSMAWNPDGQGRTSIRSGVGLFYDRPEGNLYFPLVNNPPYSLSSQYENGNLGSIAGGTAAALAPIGTIDSIDPNLKIPRTWQYSATLQRELPWGLFAEIGYVGATGRDLIRQPDINQVPFDVLEANQALPSAQRLQTNAMRPYKGYSAINYRLSDANSRYDAMQTFVSKRRGSIKWTQSYTLGSSKDNASGNGDNPENYTDKNYNWGPSSFDRRHILVETWTWDVPFLLHDKTLLGSTLGGWQVSGIYRYQSGSPLTITGNTAIGTRRADYLGGDPYVPSSGRTNANGAIVWLDPSQFTAAPETRLGNSRKGQFTGPSYQVFDLSFRKIFRVPTHDMRVTFQADLFNAFNRTNFSNPAATITSNNFGQITSVGPPRNIQLGLRVDF
jgi:Carboxypeptidase regulatory-like domain